MTLSASIEVLHTRRDEMPARAQAALDLLVADVARFQGLVEDLLEISRFDAGAIRSSTWRRSRSPSSCPTRSRQPAPRRRFRCTCRPDADEDVVRADKRRLVRVLANLLDNARVHGGGASGVSVEHVRGNGRGDSVQIVVEDHGPGVPSEERAIIFERFSRGAGAGRRGGMGDGVGLGLALVDEHVRLHGGRVWVEDRADGQAGARFVIELPVVGKPVASRKVGRADDPAPVCRPDLGRLHVHRGRGLRSLERRLSPRHPGPRCPVRAGRRLLAHRHADRRRRRWSGLRRRARATSGGRAHARSERQRVRRHHHIAGGHDGGGGRAGLAHARFLRERASSRPT